MVMDQRRRGITLYLLYVVNGICARSARSCQMRCDFNDRVDRVSSVIEAVVERPIGKRGSRLARFDEGDSPNAGHGEGDRRQCRWLTGGRVAS